MSITFTVDRPSEFRKLCEVVIIPSVNMDIASFYPSGDRPDTCDTTIESGVVTGDHVASEHMSVNNDVSNWDNFADLLHDTVTPDKYPIIALNDLTAEKEYAMDEFIIFHKRRVDKLIDSIYVYCHRYSTIASRELLMYCVYNLGVSGYTIGPIDDGIYSGSTFTQELMCRLCALADDIVKCGIKSGIFEPMI